MPPDARWFVMDCSAIAQMDSTAAGMLDEVQAEFAARGVQLCFAELHAEARALLERAGLIDRIGRSHVFEDLDDALLAFRGTSAADNGLQGEEGR